MLRIFYLERRLHHPLTSSTPFFNTMPTHQLSYAPHQVHHHSDGCRLSLRTADADDDVKFVSTTS
jgi:hypothetical protein